MAISLGILTQHFQTNPYVIIFPITRYLRYLRFRCRAIGCSGILVGEALMRAADPGAAPAKVVYRTSYWLVGFTLWLWHVMTYIAMENPNHKYDNMEVFFAGEFTIWLFNYGLPSNSNQNL